MATLEDYLRNEKPMDSALNSAHFYSRRADCHLKYGRYDDAIKNHEEAVIFLTKAISQSTIPTNIEYLKLQRKYHENIQQVIGRQKHEFEHFLLKNGLKLLKITQMEDDKNNVTSPCAVVYDSKEDENVCDDKEFFSFVNSNELKIEQSNSDKATVSENDKKDNVCDDNEFFSLVGNLKVDPNDSVHVMDQTCVDGNDSKDSEEYFSFL